ncbi:MAG: acetyl esterase/lipase [Paraglaciecola sp.]
MLISFLFTTLPVYAGDTLLKNVSYSSVTELIAKVPDKKIAYGDDPLQYGLLWLPEAQTPQQKAPLVVFIHGGCWLNAFDIKHSYAATAALAEAGYAVWSLEYRRAGDEGGGWPGSFEDILRGIEHIDKLENYAVDLNKVLLAGHSAGGHLALLAGGKMPNVSGVIGLAAISDFVTYSKGNNSCQTAGATFIGGNYSENTAAYKQANPRKQSLHAINLLLQGDADSIVPVTQASESIIPHVIITGAGHFDWIHPQSAAFQVFLAELNKVFFK